MVEKIFFLQMHDTILQRVKKFLNVKMINLLRRPAPAPTPGFFRFPPLGEVIKIYFPSPLKRGGGGVWTMIGKYIPTLHVHNDSTGKEIYKDIKIIITKDIKKPLFKTNLKILNLYLLTYFIAHFCGWGSTASMLEPLRGGSLLFGHV